MTIQTRKFWEDGDTITADKLTQMGVLAFATADENDKLTLDRTWQEAYDSMITGVVERFNNDVQSGYQIYSVYTIYKNKNLESYVIQAGYGKATITLECSSANEYPTTAYQEIPK